MNTPGVLPKPSVPWDGRRDLSACAAPSCQIELGEIVWADDVAECLAFPKADQAIGQTAKSASILAEAFATFGYTLTFGVTKTAALIKAPGRWIQAGTRSTLPGQGYAPYSAGKLCSCCAPPSCRIQAFGCAADWRLVTAARAPPTVRQCMGCLPAGA